MNEQLVRGPELFFCSCLTFAGSGYNILFFSLNFSLVRQRKRRRSQSRERIPLWFIIMQPSADVLIIGAGLSGLVAATFLKHKEPDISLLIIEQGDHPGGAVRSHIEEGYLAEAGAHGFLDNALESRVLVHEAGLTEEVEKAPLSEFVRYICLDGELKLIPQSPGKVLKAPLVSWPAKLRVLGDLWKKPLSDEPTVAQWVAHRFGKSLLPFADAVFTGTYAGDIDRLKLEAVMPGLHNLEQTHGSVLKGAVHKMWAARKESKKEGSKKEKKVCLP